MALEQSLRRQVRGYGLVSAGQVGQRPGVSREGGKFEKEVGLRSLYGMPPGRPSILAAAVPLSGGPGPQARSRSWRRNGGWESAGPGVCSTASAARVQGWTRRRGAQKTGRRWPCLQDWDRRIKESRADCATLKAVIGESRRVA